MFKHKGGVKKCQKKEKELEEEPHAEEDKMLKKKKYLILAVFIVLFSVSVMGALPPVFKENINFSYDDFVGNNGDPWNANLWIERGVAGTADINSNTGQQHTITTRMFMVTDQNVWNFTDSDDINFSFTMVDYRQDGGNAIAQAGILDGNGIVLTNDCTVGNQIICVRGTDKANNFGVWVDGNKVTSTNLSDNSRIIFNLKSVWDTNNFDVQVYIDNNRDTSLTVTYPNTDLNFYLGCNGVDGPSGVACNWDTFDVNGLDYVDANTITASFTSTLIQPFIVDPFQNAIYDFNSTSTVSGGLPIRDYNWFVDSTRVKTAVSSGDYNLHYTGFNEEKDYNITLFIKSEDGLVGQSDLNLSLSVPNITQFDFNITNQLSLTTISMFGNLSMTCTNSGADLNYTVQLNDVNVVSNEAHDNNFQLHVVDQNFIDRQNIVVFYCKNSAGIFDTETITFDSFNKNFYFVFDDTGTVLASSAEYGNGDINSVYVYSFDNNILLDLFGNNAVSFFAVGDRNSAIQIRLGYDDPTYPFTSRDFDLITLDTNSVPVCYSYLQTFYENRLYSSVERQVILKNANTLCYHVAGKTKYAFGDTLSVSSFVIPQSYNLFLVEDSIQTLLAIVDGSSAGQINLDALILKKDFARQVTITSEGATISKNCGGISTDCNTWTIVYKNTGLTNAKVVLTILNNAIAEFSHIETTNPNDFDVTFDSTDLNFNNELLTLTAVVTRTNGEIKTLTVYFTPQGQVGYIHPLVALLLSFIVFLGGITLVSMRIVFGWYGAVMVLIGLALLSFSVGAWYIVFMQAIMLIMLAFIGTTTYKQSLGAT